MKILYSIMAFILPTKSVDATVSALIKIADRLAEVEAQQNAKLASVKVQIGELKKTAENIETEAVRAANVREKLRELFS